MGNISLNTFLLTDRILTILLLPLTKTVTALVFAHSSMTNIFSLVVPKLISRTIPAFPSFSADKSSNLGTIRPFVAMAISSISGPPTHLTAGSLFCNKQMVCFIIKSPLTDNKIRSSILDLLYHLRKLVFLVVL